MKLFKITIVGNSVALRTRPHHPDSKNYGQHLETLLNKKYPDRLSLVQNISFGRATLTDIKKIEADIINKFPDLYIINLGVCDAATREIPFWFAEIINSRNNSFGRTVAQTVHHHIFKRFRPTFVKLRGKKPWISAQKFKKSYRALLRALQHNTNARIILLPINLANERVERLIPGTAKNYKLYNQIIQELSIEFEVSLVQLDDLESPVHYPDGTHFSELGNQLVAQRLLGYIEEFNCL